MATHATVVGDGARQKLLDAGERCIVRRGDAKVRMVEVADEASVARSTLYRYYPTREDLLLDMVLRRIERATIRWVAGLRRPDDAAHSIRELVLKPVAAVDDGDPVNVALYSGDRGVLASVLDDGAEAITGVLATHIGPLFKRWRDGGQLHPDLNLRETVQWMSATTSFLLSSQWRHRPASAHRRFVDRYVLRALILN
ncbi:TetR/AcrR family transcriptional regulator [Mycobacterium sp. SMC-4]|uniref:TetR/AcrR family transcriptional regulator n=1 Tax=Mycobacterium sp. SMC-4 TaxID=2857059 RepID=UPI0021B3DCF3|nr:TetR/AcrR family transcriptional regulator [Mycobacterium sp. SMC-4]